MRFTFKFVSNIGSRLAKLAQVLMLGSFARLNLSKISLGLLVLAAPPYGIALCAPATAQAEQTKLTTKSEDAAFRSFIGYRPRAAHFPPALSALSAPVEQGFQQLDAKRTDDAKRSFTQALGAAEKLSGSLNRGYQDQLWFLTGMAHEGLGHERDALKSYDRSLEIRPNNLLSVFRSGLLLKQTGQCEKAIPKFRELDWQAKALSYEMKFLIGECLVVLQKPDEAMKQFQAAYDQNPSFAPVVKTMIKTRRDLLAKSGDPKQRSALTAQLMHDLSALVRDNPGDRDASLELAHLLLQSGDSVLDSSKASRAEQLAKKFVDDSGYKDDAAARILIQAQMKRGALDQAQATLDQALQRTPKSNELAAAKRQLEIERQMKTEAEKSATRASDSSKKS